MLLNVFCSKFVAEEKSLRKIKENHSKQTFFKIPFLCKYFFSVFNMKNISVISDAPSNLLKGSNIELLSNKHGKMLSFTHHSLSPIDTEEASQDSLARKIRDNCFMCFLYIFKTF